MGREHHLNYQIYTHVHTYTHIVYSKANYIKGYTFLKIVLADNTYQTVLSFESSYFSEQYMQVFRSKDSCIK